MRHLLALLLTMPAAVASAAPLTPNQGAVSFSGTLRDADGRPGTFEVAATLKDGDFSGQGRITVSGYTVEGPIARGWLENGRCFIRIESDRSRGEITGSCDSDQIKGEFETFHKGDARRGSITGSGRAAAAPAASGTIELPTAKLTCAYQDRRIGVAPGEMTQYGLAFSNMRALTLAPAGTYAAASGGTGRFVRAGNKIELVSGPWAGAVGTIERDRSGEPAVIFHREENQTPDGGHRVDPYTTRCTRAR